MAAIVSHARAAGRVPPRIVELHSGTRWDRTGRALPRSARVPREIAAAPLDHGDAEHVVVVATHEGLMAADLAGYAGWSAIVDEAPAAVANGALRIPAAAPWFDAVYDLEPVAGTGFARVRARPGAARPSALDIQSDDLVAEMAVFHRRAASPAGVYVDVTDWADARDRKRAVRWFSAWTPRELAACADVTVSAANYFASVGHLAARRLDGDAVHYRRVAVPPRGVRRPRTVVIRHFAATHAGSTSFWATETGQACLGAVGEWPARNASPDQFWSSNDGVTQAVLTAKGVPGERVRPKLAGTNRHRHRRECTLIYSNKPQPQDAVLLDLFGLSDARITRARETEDIVQFAWRGAPRRADFEGVYTVNVYDLRQAAALREVLLAAGVADAVALEHVEVGLGLVARRPPGRPRPAAAPEEERSARIARRKAADAARKRGVREAERARRIAAGEHRGRGRPRKGGDPAGTTP